MRPAIGCGGGEREREDLGERDLGERDLGGEVANHALMEERELERNLMHVRGGGERESRFKNVPCVWGSWRKEVKERRKK